MHSINLLCTSTLTSCSWSSSMDPLKICFKLSFLHSKVALFSQFEVYNLLMKMFARYKPYSLNSSITSRKRLYNDHVLFYLSHFSMTLNAHNRHKRFIRIVVLSILKMSSRQMSPNVIGYFLLSKW